MGKKSRRYLANIFKDSLDETLILSMSPSDYKAYLSYFKIVKDPLPPSLWLLEKDFKEHFDVMSFSQIAKELGISYIAVEHAYTSGLYKLRKLLKEKGYDYEDLLLDTGF